MDKYFDRIDWARALLDGKEVGRYTDFDVYLMASACIWLDGKTEEETIDTLLTFRKVYSSMGPAGRLERIKRQTKRATQYELRDIAPVKIYKEELDEIAQCPDLRKQKVLFSMLCMAKYNNNLRENNNNWVNFDARAIFESANVHVSVEQRDLILYILKEDGYIRHSLKVTNNNIQVLYCEPDDKHADEDAVLVVSDLRRLGDIYINYLGGAIRGKRTLKICRLCGCPFLAPLSRHVHYLYCPECRDVM